MRLITNAHADLAHWVALHIPAMAPLVPTYPYGEAFGPCTAIGVMDDAGQILGAVIYHNYQPTFRSVELSFAAVSPRWLTRRIICDLLDYPFEQLGVQRVTGYTPKKAKEARAFLDKFGFKREGLVRRGFGDDDAVISGLLRKEWDQSRFNPRAPTSSVLPPVSELTTAPEVHRPPIL